MASSTLRRSAHATMNTLSSASTAALNLPSTYANYVAHNASAVSNVEQSLRSLTYLLPGARFHDAEIASESVHTFVQLLSIYHDHLLKKRASLLALSPTVLKSKVVKLQNPKPSLHARYTTFWTTSSSLYSKIATLMKIAQYTELLWEMVARRRGGEKTRWRVVVLLESFKAICRLLLMRLTNSRPLVSPPMPLREDFAPVEAEGEEEDELQALRADNGDSFDVKTALGEAGVPTPPMSDSGNGKPSASSLSISEPYSMPRTGFTLPTLPTPETVSSYLLNHVLTADDVKPAKQLLHQLTTLRGQAAEIMYILRPVVYALMMQRVARSYGYEGTKWKRHWTPWLVGFAMEYFARQMAKADLAARVPGGARNGLSALERDELKKRGWSLAWWGMRGAFYENVTKKWIHGVADSLKGRPLIDLAGTVVEEYEYLWGNYYFSTSTM
ncbi:peroxisome membrane protein [Exophiala viscosa]|uniref:Peroxisomal membrane protein PEX16 n=1 Tax=Exophiala viscosa TaxID=2486360 RepID=A0AAN6E066_9EURO|nr:peroxisome membrane protein [Exophiala viscosa]KAI1624304.1 peroxisome membrane protein [Exophiala viscosa]